MSPLPLQPKSGSDGYLLIAFRFDERKILELEDHLTQGLIGVILSDNSVYK